MKSAYMNAIAACLLGAASLIGGCGDDDDEDAGPTAPATKALADLTGAETAALCKQIIGKAKAALTPDLQCTEFAVDSAGSASECNAAKKACIADGAYEDYGEVKCKSAGDQGTFDCDTKVAEVTKCFDDLIAWGKKLSCSALDDNPEAPDCLTELSTGECGFTVDALIEDDDGPTPDGGTGSDEFVCKAGTKSYPYDFGDATCNRCAVGACCSSFAACQMNSTCACYWRCLMEGADDCFTPCDLKPDEYPDQFADHAVCLAGSCRTDCGLDEEG